MDKKNKAIVIIFAGLAIDRLIEAVKKQFPDLKIVLRNNSGSEIATEEFLLQLAENNLPRIEEILERAGLPDESR